MPYDTLCLPPTIRICSVSATSCVTQTEEIVKGAHARQTPAKEVRDERQ
jgi:hypothetical protein